MGDELSDQKDINSALNLEIQQMTEHNKSLKEILANLQGSEWQATPGGPAADVEIKVADDDVNSPAAVVGGGGGGIGAGSSREELVQLQQENSDLLEALKNLQKSKMNLAMRTSEEMQKLRQMVAVASRAYEEVTGTPIGQVAQWQGTQNLFYKTLGLGATKTPRQHQRGHGGRGRVNSMDSYRGYR